MANTPLNYIINYFIKIFNPLNIIFYKIKTVNFGELIHRLIKMVGKFNKDTPLYII